MSGLKLLPCWLAASFKDVNKKKEDIEELKWHLLEMEVDFKRKLYELQLQAASKEIKIKTNINTNKK